MALREEIPGTTRRLALIGLAASPFVAIQNAFASRISDATAAAKALSNRVPSMLAKKKSLETATETKHTLLLGNTPVEVVITSKNGNGHTFVNLHDNENVSVAAAREIIQTYGGKLVELRNRNGTRNIDFEVEGEGENERFSIDPNRFFSSEGIRKNLIKLNGIYSKTADLAIQKFVRELMRVSGLERAHAIIAIHNNTPDNLTVHSNELAPVEVSANDIRDHDDFFVVTERQDFLALKERGFNVVLTASKSGADFGSLSEYCGQKGIRYINVEAQHGDGPGDNHLAQQKNMLLVLRQILD